MNESLMHHLSKLVRFLRDIFIVTDIFIIIRFLLRNYGKKLEMQNIIKAAVIFGTATVVLWIIDYILVKRIKKDSP
jgi:hypothetical protein